MLTTVHEQFRDTLIKERKISKERARILSMVEFLWPRCIEQLVDQLAAFTMLSMQATANITDPGYLSNRGFKDWFQSFRAMVHCSMIQSI